MSSSNTGSLSTFSLTTREQSRYSISRAILAAAHEKDGGLYANTNCFELEVSKEIEQTLPASCKRHGGVFVPFGTSKRAGLDTKTSTKGAELVFTEPGAFIEFLYNKMVCRALGAEVLDGLQGNVGFPKQTGKSTGSWVAENPGVDVTDSNLTLAQIVISPKTYTSTTSFSRQLLAQSASPAKIDAVVTRDLATDSALALDKAALVGDGTGNSPTGIMNIVGVQQFTLAGDSGNGGTPTYADVVAMEQKIEDVNADTLQNFGWTTTAPIKTKLKQTPRVAGSISLPAWQGNELDAYPALVSNQLPKNLTKGTGTNLTPMIFGAWDSIALGLWGSGFELVVDPYRLKKQNMIETTSFLFCDVAVRQPVAFVCAKYCATT